MADQNRRRLAIHPARKAAAERLHREFQRTPARRTPERAGLWGPRSRIRQAKRRRSAGARQMALRLQHRPTPLGLARSITCRRAPGAPARGNLRARRSRQSGHAALRPTAETPLMSEGAQGLRPWFTFHLSLLLSLRGRRPGWRSGSRCTPPRWPRCRRRTRPEGAPAHRAKRWSDR